MAATSGYVPQYLTGQRASIKHLKPIGDTLTADSMSGFYEQMQYERSFPKDLLFQVHPWTKQVIEHDIENALGFDDSRFIWDSVKISESQQMDRQRFIIDFIEAYLGGLEVHWNDYLSFLDLWGALAGEFWLAPEMHSLWSKLPDDTRIKAEQEFMEYLGIAEQYPSRNTRRMTIYNHCVPWLCHIFSTRIMNDENLVSVARSVTDELLVPRTCCVCRREFWPIQFNPWALRDLKAISNCCLGCKLQQPKPEKFDKLIRNLVEVCGYVPNKAGSFHARSIFNQSNCNHIEAAASAYVKLGGIEWIDQTTGSWMKAVIESGAVGEQAWPTARGIRCIAKDGDVCLSLSEREIDDWLFRNQISHTKEPHYPSHPELNPTGRLRADWLVGETFIEYFGLAGNAQYDAKMQRKMDLANANGFELIPIYDGDMVNLETLLGHLRIT